MKSPASVQGLEKLGRTCLSNSFFLQDFLFSEIAAIHGIPNIPDNPDLAIAAGRRLAPRNGMTNEVRDRVSDRIYQPILSRRPALRRGKNPGSRRFGQPFSVTSEKTLKPLEILAQALSFGRSQTHAYELGSARLMSGGKDRLC